MLAAERAILHIAYVVRNPSVGVTRRHRARGGAVRCLRRQIAEMIDDYFDMYGYATNRIKVPNETGRASWNYVETADACFTGDVPAPYMREINAMYDAGITFWHDLSYVGDYNRDNSIV